MNYYCFTIKYNQIWYRKQNTTITTKPDQPRPQRKFKNRAFTRCFAIRNTFISNARLKLAKNQANTKQHPEAKLSLFADYSHSSSTISSKKIILKNKLKIKYICIHEIIQLIIMKMKIKMKNRSHRYDLGLDMDTNIVNIKSVSGDEIGTKQHLSNI